LHLSVDPVDLARLGEYLHLPEFPRVNSYDPAWLIHNSMKPNPVWLAGSGLPELLRHG